MRFEKHWLLSFLECLDIQSFKLNDDACRDINKYKHCTYIENVLIIWQ